MVSSQNKIGVSIIGAGLLAVASTVAFPNLGVFMQADKAEAAPTVIEGTEPNPNLRKCAATLLKEQGFKRSQFRIGEDVVPEDDKTKPGQYTFGDRIHTPAEAVEFFGSDTTEAEVALDTGKAQGFSEKFLTDESNAISVQLMDEFVWPGNTGFVSGKLKVFGEKKDPAGTIGVIFIKGCETGTEDAGELSALAIRGACLNPQTGLPRIPGKPEKPSNPPPSNPPPSDAKGGNFHSGGVPKGTVSGRGGNPVKVETEKKGGGGVKDTPTRTPGSETGGQAPEATTPDPDRDHGDNEGGDNNGDAGGAP